MAMPRLVACLLLKNGMIVRSEKFKHHQIIGNPISTVSRLSNWNVDELVILDISDRDFHDLRREDLAVRYDGNNTLGLLRYISEVTCMPLSFGGRIRNLEDIRQRLEAGADKCVINSMAFENPEFIKEAAAEFGSQCIVISIDGFRHPDGRLEAFVEGGKKPTGLTPAQLAQKVESLGVGEIFLNSIDRDGMACGYDIDLIKSVTQAVKIPVIACGGVGKYSDFPAGINEGKASAVAAANIFNFYELAYPYAKKACIDAGLKMRKVGLNSRWFPREPVYNFSTEKTKIEERLERARRKLGPAKVLNAKPEMRWCSSCLYPLSSATYMELDAEGRCMGCRTSDEKFEFPQEEWERRKKLLIELLEKSRCPHGSRHDCVIGVSGGKDSYFQTHYIKNVLGFNPLLVTYFGNNYSDVGLRNLYRMKEVFNVDHIIVHPSVETLKKLNRLGFIVMGDMNWHNHMGIATTPMREAALRDIPLVIWGEHGEMDLSGQFSMSDFVEHTYRHRLEQEGRSFEWNFMVGHEGITSQDMIFWKYPSDADIFRVGLKGVHLGNYVPWEGNENLRIAQELYDFEVSEQPFERTYRKGSNLDDIHENGMHDYLKFVKFGYGRCTDHASKDIRSGKLSRQEGIELVRHYDHVKSSDLERWLEYTGMTEAEFDAIADTFRNPRVWHKDANGQWIKQNIWDKES